MFISDRAERQNQPVLLPDPSNRLFLFPVGRIVKSPVLSNDLGVYNPQIQMFDGF